MSQRLELSDLPPRYRKQAGTGGSVCKNIWLKR